MTSRSSASFFFTFQLFAVLSIAVSVAVNVAARSVNPHHGHHTQLSGGLSESFELVNVLEWKTHPESNELPEFQIAVRVKGQLEYLYADGEKVLSTPRPDSVGTRRTVWQVVDAPSDFSALSALSFALQNKDTGARLYYDFETKSFYGVWVESGLVSPLTNWRLWRSVEEGSRFKLQSIQGAGRGQFAEWPSSDEPQIFHIVGQPRPLRELPYVTVRVEVGTKFQLTVRENGEELYLYSKGEKVLKTADPDSVGTERTIWESVAGIVPPLLEYADAFAIRNTRTGFVLQYDGDFYGQNVEGTPLAGWKLVLYIVEPAIYPPPPKQYKLTYLPHSNGFIPGTFNYLPVNKGVGSLKTVA